MQDITSVQRVRLEELGYRAAQRCAATLNAGNAVEFAGESLARRLSSASTRDRFHRAVMEVQLRARLSLLPLAELPESQRSTAPNAFVCGLFRFSFGEDG